ncbi:hypothetical protein LMG33818_001538 [Halomonadaceae bacterium LMG 33818]|uniref:hypothetical protein n=1 Tax=Cernens ardua TaxID=3402176 RepID=UPI003EDC5000
MDSSRYFDSHNRPLMLNRFIIVTVITIVVALGYMGNYYLGENTGKHTTWYALPLMCSPFHSRCMAYTGVSERLGLRLHSEGNGIVQADAFSSNLDNPQFEFRLLSLGQGPARIMKGVRVINDHQAQMQLSVDECVSSVVRWRIELRAKAGNRLIGTWTDISRPCVH